MAFLVFNKEFLAKLNEKQRTECEEWLQDVERSMLSEAYPQTIRDITDPVVQAGIKGLWDALRKDYHGTL